ncbi:hypothetical protein EYF80_018755 [Liparis tanakae]|uniref:Uncharacterized protein n=1 Tax=Liparis tanakae TaxID=230148 RepID=A0A4Z2HYK6_9TELE|nr:hypothetical protein EYF80_018755 [Liparis tanakae]
MAEELWLRSKLSLSRPAHRSAAAQYNPMLQHDVISIATGTGYLQTKNTLGSTNGSMWTQESSRILSTARGNLDKTHVTFKKPNFPVPMVTSKGTNYVIAEFCMPEEDRVHRVCAALRSLLQAQTLRGGAHTTSRRFSSAAAERGGGSPSALSRRGESPLALLSWLSGRFPVAMLPLLTCGVWLWVWRYSSSMSLPSFHRFHFFSISDCT